MRHVADGEFELGSGGIPPTSLERQLSRADTIGQNEFGRLTGGGFVADQRAFELSAAVEYGLGLALLHELALQRPSSTTSLSTELVGLPRIA